MGGNDDAALDPFTVPRLVEHEPYDADDQFYQAFKAGYVKARVGGHVPHEAVLWHAYQAWIFEGAR